MSEESSPEGTSKLNIVERLSAHSVYLHGYGLGHSRGSRKRIQLILSETAFFDIPGLILRSIEPLRKKGYMPQVELDPQRIPNGYVAVVYLWNGAKLKLQAFLRQQEEDVVETVIFPC